MLRASQVETDYKAQEYGAPLTTPSDNPPIMLPFNAGGVIGNTIYDWAKQSRGLVLNTAP